MPDGTYDYVVYAEDKYYKNDNGDYVEIDNSIVKDVTSSSSAKYEYTNADAPIDIDFKATASAVSLSTEEEQIAFSLIMPNSTSVSAIAGGSSAKYKVDDFALYGDNFIAYENVFEDVDVVYETHTEGVKEYFLLKSAASPSEFKFKVSAAGYTA